MRDRQLNGSPSAPDEDGFFRLRGDNLLTGWIAGLASGGACMEKPDGAMSPQRALEEALLPALQSGRCRVTFSGGRDSSVVLAGATDVARRLGLADPVPLTRI